MITVTEALAIVQSNTKDFGIEEIPLSDAIGRTLREEIIADRDFPPYDRVTMDGIAISYASFQNGERNFRVAGVAAAGVPKQSLEDPNACLEVMTGAIMPSGVDSVIRYEDLTIIDEMATVNLDEIKFQQNIHFKGSDRKAGDVIIPSGLKISSSEIGVCATVGKHSLKVSKLPKSIIISSGDELVEINEQPLSHQIRRSNVYRLETLLKNYQIPVTTAHLADDFEEIVNFLKEVITQYDLVILSGGVSKGKFDYLPEALNRLGVKKLFHKIQQRPGKPFWFGKYENTATVFAFPGNPVSSFMCAQYYLKSWLNKSTQTTDNQTAYAILNEDVYFKPNLTYFLEVKLHFNAKGQIIATPIKGNGSGDLANLVDADAFIQLPQGKSEFKKGEVYPFITYRSLF